MRSGNVEQHDLVGPCRAVSRGQFRGVAGVAQLLKLHALYDASSR